MPHSLDACIYAMLFILILIKEELDVNAQLSWKHEPFSFAFGS